jgi:microcin C transport system substrate-binding protein
LHLTRRLLLRNGVLTGLSSLIGQLGQWMLANPAAAQTGAEGLKWWHGLSLFGEFRYPPGFKHFDYVNPHAPKLGAVRMMALGSFDNFNEVVAGLKGSLAMGAGAISDTLMVAALDEVSTRSRCEAWPRRS